MELAGDSVDSRGNACREDLEGVEGALADERVCGTLGCAWAVEGGGVEGGGVVGECPLVSTLG